MVVKKDIDSRMAEEFLLSSLLYKPDKIVEVIDEINPAIFSVREFGEIYKCIIELYKDDVAIDEVMVMNKACSLGYIIPPELIKKLANSRTFVTKKQLKNYCQVIKNAEFKRRTIDVCTNYLEKVKDINEPEKIIGDFFNVAINLSDKLNARNNVSSIDINTNSILEDIDYRYNNPDIISGIPFGFKTIDHYMDGAEPGDIITIGGQNSHGKSYFAQVSMINMALYLVKNKIDKKILFISLEMTREQIEKRLLSIITGVDKKYFKNPKQFFIDRKIPDNEKTFQKFKENIANATKFLNKLPIIIDDSSVLSVEEIVGEVKKHILKDGIACTFIDYVGLIENNKQEDYINISYSYKILKKLAKESQSPIIILNQYLKDFKGREKSGYKPNMFDMTGGKSAMNDSHKIIHIWKPDKFPDFVEKHPEYIGKIIAFSDKNRDGAFGDMPEVPLQFENGQLKETLLVKEQTQNLINNIFIGLNTANNKQGDSENV